MYKIRSKLLWKLQRLFYVKPNPSLDVTVCRLNENKTIRSGEVVGLTAGGFEGIPGFWLLLY